MLTQSPSSPSLNKLKRPLKPLTDHRSQSVLKKSLSRKTLENSLTSSSNLLGVSSTAKAHTQIHEDSMMTKMPLNTSNLIASPRSNLMRKPGKPSTLLKLGRRSPAKNSLAELDLSKGNNQTEAHSRDFSLERSRSPNKGDKSASSALDLSLLPEKRNLLKPLEKPGALSLREELQKEVDASPLCKVDNSALFYDTIKHLDDCGKCFTSCKKHHKSPFTVDYRGPRESVYRRDFSPAAVIQTEPSSSTMISSSIYESPKPKLGVPINSTHRNDYRVWDSNLVKDKGPVNSLGPNNGSYFWGKSTYNASYYDYGSPKVREDLRNTNPSAALDLPFTARSLYQKDFSGLDLANSPKKTQRKERSPLPLGSIFLGETSNARVYKNYNVSPVPSTLARRDNDEEYDGGTPAYLNQYKSTYGKDFIPKIEPKCAANQYAETHDVPRLRKPLPRHNV